MKSKLMQFAEEQLVEKKNHPDFKGRHRYGKL